jgi:hypothetical protein
MKKIKKLKFEKGAFKCGGFMRGKVFDKKRVKKELEGK